jgi:hypothetical protein
MALRPRLSPGVPLSRDSRVEISSSTTSVKQEGEVTRSCRDNSGPVSSPHEPSPATHAAVLRSRGRARGRRSVSVEKRRTAALRRFGETGGLAPLFLSAARADWAATRGAKLNYPATVPFRASLHLLRPLRLRDRRSSLLPPRLDLPRWEGGTRSRTNCLLDPLGSRQDPQRHRSQVAWCAARSSQYTERCGHTARSRAGRILAVRSCACG